MTKPTALTLAALTAALTLAGCGQRGDLYLPSQAVAPQRATLTETLTPAPASAAGSASDTAARP